MSPTNEKAKSATKTRKAANCVHHWIIDGREAVTFLVRVKECIEEPERILLDI